MQMDSEEDKDDEDEDAATEDELDDDAQLVCGAYIAVHMHSRRTHRHSACLFHCTFGDEQFYLGYTGLGGKHESG